ncbi:MAG: replicative DNA helicase [Magnetococcus sp. DMHC-6]
MQESPPFAIEPHENIPYDSYATYPPELENEREKENSERRPSYSMEAEQSVLGAILLDNSVLDHVADILKADDFYVGAHQTIFKAILAMSDRGEVADPVLLKQYLDKNAALDQVGGPSYLARLVNTVPAAANARAYARIVQDKSVLRELATQATEIVDHIFRNRGPLQVDAVLDDAEQRIFSIAEKKEHRRSNYYDLKSILVPVFEHIDLLMTRKETITGVPTGFIDLDKLLAGFQPADLIILAARPSMGKTALAMNIAANAALDHQAGVGVFSLEMSKEQLVLRLISSTARVDAQSIRTGWISPEDYGRLTQTADTLSKVPIYIDDTPAISIAAMRAKARRLKREKDIKLIVVDYLQLMVGSGQTENRVQEISEISRGLKAIAKELGVPVLALSQLSREVEKRPDKRPVLSDLRESGAIEQDADVVIFVYREEVYNKEDPALVGRAEAIISKQRNGPIGNVKLTFVKQYTRFENFASTSGYV